MDAKVEKTNQELVTLEAEAAAKKGESSPSSLTPEESKGLIEQAFKKGSGTFESAEDASLYDCGYGDAAFEADNFDEIAGWYETAAPAFETVAKAELSGKGKAVQRTAFESACKALLQGFTCSELCGELGNVAVQNSAKEGNAMGGPTYEELLVMVRDKRAELERAENDQKECSDSVATIAGLYTQFTTATKVLTTQKTICNKSKRMLRMASMQLRRKKMEFEAAKVEDKKAQD